MKCPLCNHRTNTLYAMENHLEHAHMPQDGQCDSVCGWCGRYVGGEHPLFYHLFHEVGLDHLKRHIEENAHYWLPFAYEPQTRIPF